MQEQGHRLRQLQLGVIQLDPRLTEQRSQPQEWMLPGFRQLDSGYRVLEHFCRYLTMSG